MIEHTKSKPQETLKFKKNRQMEIISDSPPINLVEEGKRLLAKSAFEGTNSVFNLTNGKNTLQ